ncbi:4-hydroxythreonine-4-phosphate dehydrogenase PdxA [bacterium]|nr:4-hydroxythreonine-4-phosphate dehydrogenase PdxA [bacterium]
MKKLGNSDRKSYKVIGITCGDLGGVGPELCLSLLENIQKYPETYNCGKLKVVLFGSKQFMLNGPLKFDFERLNIKFLKKNGVQDFVSDTPLSLGNIGFVDCDSPQPVSWTLNKESKENGIHSYSFFNKAIDWANNGLLNAIVTAPINKMSWNLADVPFSGHTTMLKEKTGVDFVSMGFYTERLKTVLATVHVPFKDVPDLLTYSCLKQALESCLEFMCKLGVKCPKIAVAGLNPHASEDGLFGTEENEILIPFVKRINSDSDEKGMFGEFELTGPYPADTLYHRAYMGDFDCVLSLYHDQGLIPVKLLSFHEAVNVTLGLPFIRTSPDHGTAYDIAYQGKASASSMEEAFKLAVRLC